MSRSKSLRRHLLAAVGVASLCTGGAARAAGFYLEDQAARASGRAFSGEAADMGAASLFYNPAAIAGVERSEFEGSITPILVDATVRDSGSTIKYPGQAAMPISGPPTVYKPIELGVVPSSASVLRINDQFSVGLAVSSPFSFATKYDDRSDFTRYSGITTRLTTIDAQPTLAWRPFHWLGIGAGPVIEYSNAVLSTALPELTPGGTDGYLDLHGNNYNVGYAAGAQLHLDNDRLTLGGAYRSRIHHVLSGLYKVDGLQGFLGLVANTAAGSPGTSASASFNTPWSATFSVRYRLTDRLTVEGQGVRFGWSQFREIGLQDPAGLLPSQTENYHDSTSGAVGFDYAVNRFFTVRGGVQYDQTPTSEGFRDVRVPDGDRFLFAGGYSLKVGPHMVFDGAISYIDFIPSHINQTVDQYANVLGAANGVLINTQGEVHANAETFSVGAHYYF